MERSQPITPEQQKGQEMDNEIPRQKFPKMGTQIGEAMDKVSNENFENNETEFQLKEQN